MLTKEDIQFIDNYLLKSEVIYKDIRVEMVDHVANAVEERMQTKGEDFYDAFKTYMVQHKKELLKDERTYVKNIRRQLLKDFLKYLFSVNTLVLAFVIFAIHKFLFNVVQLHSFKQFYLIYFLSVNVLLAVYYIVKYKPFKEKFSVMGILFSRHLFIWFPWQILASSFHKITLNYKICIAYTILTVVVYAYWKTAGKYMKKYNKAYHIA